MTEEIESFPIRSVKKPSLSQLERVEKYLLLLGAKFLTTIKLMASKVRHNEGALKNRIATTKWYYKLHFGKSAWNCKIFVAPD